MRQPYDKSLFLTGHEILVVKKRGGGEREIKAGQWWINKGTECGEEADLYEHKPYDGSRYIPRDTIIAVIVKD